MIISFIISHDPTSIEFDTETEDDGCTPIYMSSQCDHFLYTQMQSMLAMLLRKTLGRILGDLDLLIQKGNKSDWPTIIFTLCIVFFAVESMAVDIYLRTRTVEQSTSICQNIEYNAIFALVERLKISTSGLNALDLDWNLAKNRALLNGDAGAIQGFQYLQQSLNENCESVPVQNPTLSVYQLTV